MRVKLVFLAIGALVAAVLVPLAYSSGASALGAGRKAADGPVVRVDDGLLRGVASHDVRRFSGIPFAAPPIGALRWRPPQPEAKWSGIRDATTPSQPCLQRGRSNGPAVIGSEDCLYLNVTTPTRHPTSGPLPVMVWIHGGGFNGGSGADYDPTRLVQEGNVIVVTVNYRLGAFGFLDLPGLSQDPYAGNYALADQQAAMRWVRRNAAAFGGDPHNVTVSGQSAGGYAVCAHLAAPASRGLFDRAIAQSGPCGNQLLTPAVARQRGSTVAAKLGCAPPSSPTPADVVACMRAKSATDLVGVGAPTEFTAAGLSSTAWEFVAGTPALPQQPLQALQDGTAAPVPLIQGNTRDEMRQFVASIYDRRGKPLQPSDYPAVLKQIFGDQAAKILAHYPLSKYPSAGIALSSVLTDWGHAAGACTVLPADNAAARRAPVYTYEFAQDNGQHVGDFPLGATHGSDLPYLFDGTYDWTTPPPPDPGLSNKMIGYWTRFAHTGDPNAPALPRWPRYHSDGTALSLSAAHIEPIDFAAEHQCAFWNTLQSSGHHN